MGKQYMFHPVQTPIFQLQLFSHFLDLPCSGRNECFGIVWDRRRGRMFRGRWDTRRRRHRRRSVECSSRQTVFRCRDCPAETTTCWPL